MTVSVPVPPPPPASLRTAGEVADALRDLATAWAQAQPPLPPRPPATDPAWRERIEQVLSRAANEMEDPDGPREEVEAAWHAVVEALAAVAGDQLPSILRAVRGFDARLRLAGRTVEPPVPPPVPTMPEDVGDIVRQMAVVLFSRLPLPWDPLTHVGVRIVPGTLSVIAAATSHGKSVFLLNTVLNLLRNDPNGIVIHHSSEMRREQVFARALSLLAAGAPAQSPFEVEDLSYGDRSVADVLVLYGQSGGDISALHLPDDLAWAHWTMFGAPGAPGLAARWYLSTNTAVTALDLERHISDLLERAAKAGKRVLAVVVDYVQDLLPVPENDPNFVKFSRSRELEIAAATRMLARLAEDLNLPVITAAQFNRNIRYDSNKDYVPALEYMYGSGVIEQKAAIALGLRNVSMVRAPFKDVDPNKQISLVKVRGDYAFYRDTFAVEDLRLASLAARASIDQTYPGATLMEVYVLKNRLFGAAGWVIPLVFRAKSGVIRQPEAIWLPEDMLPEESRTMLLDRRTVKVRDLMIEAGLPVDDEDDDNEKTSHQKNGKKRTSPHSSANKWVTGRPDDGGDRF